MPAIPDFSKIKFLPTDIVQSAVSRNWRTPEGIEIKNTYGPADIEGLSFVDGFLA